MKKNMVMGMKLPQILHFSSGFQENIPTKDILGLVFELWMGWIEFWRDGFH